MAYRYGSDRICYLLPNGSTYEGDPIWKRIVPVSNRSYVNRVNPSTTVDPIPCKRGLCSSKTAHCLAKSWLKQMNQTGHPFTQLNMQQMVLQIQDLALSWNFKLRGG